MTGFGFVNEDKGGNARITLYKDEIQKLTKRYKKIRKYMKSSLYSVRQMDGTEDYVNQLLEEYKEDPMD